MTLQDIALLVIVAVGLHICLVGLYLAAAALISVVAAFIRGVMP